MRKAGLILSFLLGALLAFADSQIKQKAEELYAKNQLTDAKPLLEQAISENPMDVDLYLQLGTVNQIQKNYDKAIEILKKGLLIAKDNKAEFYYDIGNNYWLQGKFSFAEEMYTNAIGADGSYSLAYLDRANVRMELESYEGAAADYTIYLQLRPQDPQRPQIEALLAALQKMQDAIAQKKQDEEAKQKSLMNDVLNSLNNASSDTKNLSVESLQFKKETEDVDIED